MSRCLRCHRFNGFNPEIHGFFCCIKCQIEFSEEGSIKITQKESDKIYQESKNESLKEYWNKRYGKKE